MANAINTPPKTRQQSTAVDSARRSYAINQKLLLITLSVFAIAMPSSYFWYKYQLGKTANAFLARAEQLEQEQNWSKATSYYQRYLMVHPEDAPTLVKMVEAYAKGKPTPRRIFRLTRLLYQAIGRAPERNDLRLMLAENLLKLGDLGAAEEEAAKLSNIPGVEQLPAKKILALSQFTRSRDSSSESIATAVEALVEVAEKLPGDVQLVAITANALRKHSAEVQLQGRTTATAADEMMDQLVAKNPENVEALIARHQYRTLHQLDDPQTDLQAALELSPNNLEILLLSAGSAAAKGGQEELVTELLQRAVTAAPTDHRAYLALAKIAALADDHEESIKLLRQGLTQTDSHLQLSVALCEELIVQRELKKAAQVLRNAESKSAQFLLQLNAASRVPVENQLRLLHAKLDLANEKQSSAKSVLQTILLSTEANQSRRQSPAWIQATSMLARIASGAGEWDKAAAHWEKLALAFPRNEELCQSAVAAHLNAGDAANAIKRLSDFSRLVQPTADMQLQLTQAHLAMQLKRPASERNWAEFLEALEDAKENSSERWELTLAEVDYLLADSLPPGASSGIENGESSTENHTRATEVLRSSESAFESEASFWRGAARTYQRLALEADAQRALDQYLKNETSAIQRAKTRVAFLRNAGNFVEAEELLAAVRSSFSDDERREIDRLRIEILTTAKKNSEAQKLVTELIATDSKDPKLLAMGIELSLRLGDFTTAEEWEASLGQFESSQFDWRYLRSLRQLLSYDRLDTTEKDELARAIASIRSQRPRWYQGVALSAWHAQLEGNLAQAQADYRLAVDLGDRRAHTIEQLVALLYQDDRLNEAEKYLSLFSSGASGSVSRDSLAIQLALKQDRISDALTLAKQGLERFPDEVMRHIWLANLTLRNQQPKEAIQILRQASKRFPDDARVWKGLFTLFTNTGRTEDARKTLQAILAGDALPLESRHFVAAQGFETLGDLEASLQHYKQAVALSPQKTAIRLRYAKQLLTTDTSLARNQYEQILRQSPDSSEARRELASLLAATGKDEDWERAYQLLSQKANDSLAESAANDRLRAMLLVRQGTPVQRLANCEPAREILQQLIRTSGNQERDINRRLLASIYEQEANLANDRSLLFAAREQLRYLVDRENPSPQNLTLYIEFLIRHATSESSTGSVEKTGPDALVAASAELREIFLADAESRLQDLQKAQLSQDLKAPTTLANVDLTVQLLQAQGQDEKATEYVAKWVNDHDYQDQDKSTQAQLYLMTGQLYSRLGQYSEAEKWYRRLMEIAPKAYVMVVQTLVEQGKQQEAAELCLEVAEGEPDPEEAILLTQVMLSATQANKILPGVQKVIEQVVSKNSDNLDLLQAEAVMRASQGEYDQAIASFRRMIEADSKNALAMNNLATLLAERPNQRAEALEYVDRAVGIAGRLPALLDTQGTIFLKMADFSQAILCLEEAVAGGATDPRYHFHLAAAYEAAGRLDDAAASLKAARDYGLEKSVLTDDDRSLLNHLDEKISANPLHVPGVN